GLAGLDEDAGDDAWRGRAELVLHLHGLHDDDALAGLDGLAGLDLDADDEAGHGRADGRWPGGRRDGGGDLAEGAGALVEDVGVEGDAVEVEGPAAGPETAGGEFEAVAVGEEVAQGRAGDLGQLCGDGGPVDGDGVAVDGDLEGAAVQGDDVTHSSSATVSTCV